MFVGVRFLGATAQILSDQNILWPALEGLSLEEQREWPDVIFFSSNAAHDLEAVRDWALREKIILDEGQLLNDEMIKEISGIFAPLDELSIAVHVTHSPQGYSYLEYPFVPVKTLAIRALQVEIIYWALESDSRRHGSLSDRYGVRFGFTCSETWVTP